jgi:hypothetical protein
MDEDEYLDLYNDMYNGSDKNSMFQSFNNLDTGSKYQLGLGASQILAGAFTKKGTRPKMPIPGAVQEATALAKMQANATVRPGNDYAIDQIHRNSGMGINALNRTANSSSQILAGLESVNANANASLRDNANQNTLFKFNATQNLQNSLAKLGQYQNQQWQTNVMQPYMDRVQTKNMLTGAGIQNMSGAFNNISQMKMYDKYFGKD